MSGSNNNPGSEQFSLVSLDKSQQAASSYTNMSRRAKGESDSTLSINEDDANKPAPPPPKPAAAKEPAKKDASKKTAPIKAPPMRSEDAMDQSLDDILVKLDEFNRSVKVLAGNASVAARNISLVVLTPLLPLLNRLLKLLNIPLQFVNLLAGKINQRMGSTGGSSALQPVSASGASEAVHEEEPAAPPPPAAKTSNFSDMLELNIVFTDNMKKALYKKKPGLASTRMGAMEEDLILSNALLAISECAEFTSELPNPATGLYAGQRIYDIMANVTKDDVAIFLGFVKAYPGKYIGKEWKISETFATWLINNAPIAE
ncbi:MAG: hypothetical protein ACO1RX_17685 [Candidatus Sericytochromatia bacterium]